MAKVYQVHLSAIEKQRIIIKLNHTLLSATLQVLTSMISISKLVSGFRWYFLGSAEPSIPVPRADNPILGALEVAGAAFKCKGG